MLKSLTSRLRQTYVVSSLLLALAYYLSGRLGLLLAIPPGYSTIVWPASGFALGVILVYGYRVVPGILLGSFLVNLYTGYDGTDTQTIIFSYITASIIAAGASLQAVISALLVKRFVKFPNPLENLRDIAILFIVGGVLGCQINASIGVTYLTWAGVISEPQFGINWLTWWMGDALGVLVFAPITILLLTPTVHTKLTRKMVVGVTVAAVFLIAIYAFYIARALERESQRVAFEHSARNLEIMLQSEIETYQDILHSISRYYAASDDVEPDEFKVFVDETLHRYPSIYAISWNEKVLRKERPAYEKKMAQRGFKNFAIKDMDDKGGLTIAPERDVYFPVSYSEPMKRNGHIIGFDTYLQERRRVTLDMARDSDEAIMTGKIDVLTDKGTQDSVVFYKPIYRDGSDVSTQQLRRENLLGYAAGVFTIPSMMQSILVASSIQRQDFAIIDANAPKGKEVLFDSREYFDTGVLDNEAYELAEYKWLGDLNIAGHNLSIKVVPSHDYFTFKYGWTVWFVLVGGIIMTGITGMFMLVVTARTDIVTRLVEEKTRELNRNIGLLQKQEHELKSSEEKFRSSMENASIGMALVAPDGKFLKVNHALCKILGYKESELLKLDFQTITHKDDLNKDLSYVRRMLTKQITTYQMEKRYIHKNQDIIWILLNVSLALDAEGQPDYFISQIQDISERKNAEDEREKLIKKLVESNDELERFAYVASHDMQEPLRMISNFSGLLKAEHNKKLGKEAVDYLNMIGDGAMRMHAMITDLLQYAKLNNKEIRFVDVNANLEMDHVIQNLSGVLKESDAKVTHDNLPIFKGNPVQFMRLLQNLIGNALKYQREGVKPKVHVGVEEEEDSWIFTVEDNGIGIDKEYLNQIFEPFKRLHTWQQYKGTGIGLAVCKRIVQNHEGKIWATSVPDEGSIFYFTIPKK